MSERSNALQIFLEIDEAIRRINRRFSTIKRPGDFIRDDDGLDRLDGIAMMLISVSENFVVLKKYLDKKD